MTTWSKMQCSDCGGHGLVSSYSANDFEGAAECNVCEGSGFIFVYSNGRLAKWPGGPFLGSLRFGEKI